MGHFSKNEKWDVHVGMSGGGWGYRGGWGTYGGVSWSKTIILSGHIFFEKSAIYDFLSFFGGKKIVKNSIFFKYLKLYSDWCDMLTNDPRAS